MDLPLHNPALLAVVVLAVAAEIFWRLRTGRGYDRADAFASLRIGIGNIVFGLLNAALLTLILTYAFRLAPLHLPLNDWRTWAAGFVLVEFAYYWFHRLSHQMRWLWASHVVHHSTEQLILLSAIRLGWTNFLSAGWMVYLPLVLAGIPPVVVLTMLTFNLRYQFFLHTEAPMKFGPLEWLFNTPTHHRVHHASNGPYLDKNYGGVLIVFDRMFGSFAALQPGDRLVYGLVEAPPSQTTLGLALGEWGRMFGDMRRAPSILSAARLAFARP